MRPSYAEKRVGEEAEFCFFVFSACSWKLAKALAACVTKSPSYAHLCVLVGGVGEWGWGGVDVDMLATH